jgi:alpha-tubulin suppressor-like RCC1 family protein/endonuclease/exonuclease/phosphatase family metal-dependent hydrolase
VSSAPTGPLRDRRLVVGLAAVLVVGALAVTARQVSRGAEPRVPEARQAAARPTPACADALVVGIDGNGEHAAKGRKVGPTVDAVVRRVVARAEGSGRRVSVISVPLTTRAAASVLRTRHSATSHASAVVSKPHLRGWRAPIAAGVSATLARVASATSHCPDRPVLLVGYAQGASVAHRVLSRVAAEGGLSGLVGGVLISDPDKVRHSVATPVLGDPPAARSREGLLPKYLSAVADVPRSQGSYAVWSVCTKHDLVCDPSRASVRDSLAATRYAGRAVLGAVARSAWRQLALWPVPSPAQQVLTGVVGDAIHLQLTVAKHTRGSVAWGEATGLPPGVTLSTSGLLSGTPTKSGTFHVKYRTRGTAPATTGHTGEVVITIAPSSTSLSAGGQSTCQTRSDGTARCWGRNDYGQLGDGSTKARDVPGKVSGTGWSSISTNGMTTCAIKQDGSLWCWGLDNFGQVGIGRGAPVRTPHRVGGSQAWSSVSVGLAHACATKRNGALWCWGQNLWGQLGIGTTNRQEGRPARVGKGSWRSVTAGGWHTCALDAAGTAYCWGHNSFGEVGDGTVRTRTVPTRVKTTTTFLQLSANSAHTCGVTLTGKMRCWGFNRQGQLGDGTLTNSATSVKVVGNHVWTQVTTSDGTTCGTADDGSLWCWGDNRYGQLGTTPSVTPDPTPSPVPLLDGPVQMASSGWLHTCAIPVGGSFVCWGNDEVGQLGDGVDAAARQAAPASRPAYQVDLDPGDVPSQHFLDHASPGRIAAEGLASRPAAAAPGNARTTAAASGPVSPFTIVSMNVLGSQHTAANGGDEPEMAPGRLRAEWGSIWLRMKNASLVGLQESQPDQIVAYDAATSHEYAFYPGNSIGYSGAPQSVMWKRSEWKLVWHSSISIPFPGGYRPQPIVELQQRSTGASVYWINVHFWARAAHQAERNKAMTILLKAIKKLKGDKIPILLTGDFNQIAPAFCPIVGQTPLNAATGGSNTGGHCVVPAGARIDWIFGSRGDFSGATFDDSAQIRRTTDHHVLSARFAGR